MPKPVRKLDKPQQLHLAHPEQKEVVQDTLDVTLVRTEETLDSIEKKGKEQLLAWRRVLRQHRKKVIEQEKASVKRHHQHMPELRTLLGTQLRV